MKKNKRKKIFAVILAAMMTVSLAGCNTGGSDTQATEAAESTAQTEQALTEAAASEDAEAAVTEAVTVDAAKAANAGTLTEDDVTINDTVENSEDGGHAITADGEEASYSNTKVVKTGDSDSGDEADFYGENAAIFATNGGTLTLSEMVVKTDGTHANGVFSYGEGTTIDITDSYIETSGNCSGGLMTTGGGTTNAKNLTITTSGYTTSGTGSPVIYSTADITVSNADLTSTASQGVVVEGKNSVTLKNVTLCADNNTKNSDKSDWYQAVMIYQSMSGDAAEGLSSFTMEGGTLNNANGDIFFVNNTATEIHLTNAAIVNNDTNGYFLRAAAAGWGSEGSNGGQVSLYAAQQAINGNMIVDDVSNLNLYLSDGSTFNGAINSDGQAGEVYVELSGGSKWVLSGDSYITSLTCDADSIDLNGHKLYVGGEEYTAGTASAGEAIEVVSTGGGEGGAPDKPGEDGGSDHGTPPDKPASKAN